MAVSRRTSLGIALLVAGLLLVGVAAAGYVDGQRCRLTQEVGVAQASDATGQVTPYSELSEPAQRVFAATLEAESPALARQDVIDPGLVEYENETYRVTVHRRSGCSPLHPLYVETPLVVGATAVAVGVVLARGRDGDLI